MNIFIIGNGESRKDFDLNLLKGNGIVVGCNAIYRDFQPNILVAMDGKYEGNSTDYGIIKEIRECCNFLDKVIFVYRKRYSNKLKDIELWVEHYKEVDTLINTEITKHEIQYQDEGWASGPTSVLVMLRDIFPYHFFIRNVYLIGFDLSRLPNGRANSFYKDTNNYTPSKSPGATHSTSANQLKRCFTRFRDVNFLRVIEDVSNFPKEWGGCDNVKNITYERLLNDIR